MTDIPAGMVAGGQRWQHVKRGTMHEVIGVGELQMQSDLVDGSSLVIYRGDDGRLWAREEGEFTDGRFVLTETPRQPTRTADLIDAGPNTHDAALGLVAGVPVTDAEGRARKVLETHDTHWTHPARVIAYDQALAAMRQYAAEEVAREKERAAGIADVEAEDIESSPDLASDAFQRGRAAMARTISAAIRTGAAG